MGYEAYWNDESIEQSKPYGVRDVADGRLLDFLEHQTNLRRAFEAGLDFLDREFGALRGFVLDLGAGVCWTSAIISRRPLVERVCALDISAHRLFRIAPLVLEQFGALQTKIVRQRAAMCPLPFAEQTADLIIFCQALYMSRSPVQLLREAHRVLRRGGAVMISDESVEGPGRSLARIRAGVKSLAREPFRNWGRALAGRAPDASGRYPYVDAQYARFVAAAGFKLAQQSLPYPLFRNGPVTATNWFGVK